MEILRTVNCRYCAEHNDKTLTVLHLEESHKRVGKIWNLTVLLAPEKAKNKEWDEDGISKIMLLTGPPRFATKQERKKAEASPHLVSDQYSCGKEY